jgi:hypothetical protein
MDKTMGRFSHNILVMLKFSPRIMSFAGRLLKMASLLAAVFLAAVPYSRLLLSSPAVRLESPAQVSSREKGSTKSAAKDLPVPFRSGEVLKYQVSWMAFPDAASVQLRVVDRLELRGMQVWHFAAEAHSVNPLRQLFAIDDRFDSYAEAATLASRQFETHLSELGRKQDQVLVLQPKGSPSRNPAPVVIVEPGTRDPLSVIYWLRAIDWQRTPAPSTPLYDGHDVYEMRASLEAPSEQLSVMAGKFSALRIKLRVSQSGREVNGIDLMVWLAADSVKTPLVIEASIPLGTFRAELTGTSR